MRVLGFLYSLKARLPLPNQSQGYTAIPAPVSQEEARRQQQIEAHERGKLFKYSMAGLFVLVILFMTFAHSGRPTSEPGCEINGNCTHTSKQLWGQYSPWFSVPSEIDAAVPKGCEVTFVNVMSRHGARHPTLDKAESYTRIIDQIHNSATNYGRGFEFLENFVYSLRAEDLTVFGENEMRESGTAFYKRYTKLAEASDPFVRSAGSFRVIYSGHNFTQALYEAQGKDSAEQIRNFVVIPEEVGWNNTLNHNNCPSFATGPSSRVGFDRQSEWKETFTPGILERLNRKLPGANMTMDDAILLMDLCPYHTVDTPDAALSDFCRLFSEDEWRDYDYYETLGKFYGFGPGNPMGPTQGAGYANELIARLTGQPVQDTTNTNRTMVEDPSLFPLDRTMYLDFTHDNSMVSIMAILGLYNETEQLPTRYRISPEKAKGFASAWVVPFGGRMNVEKMKCVGDDDELVRVLVNDRVMALKSCGGDGLGRCKLDAFVESLSFARSGGQWEACFT